MISRNIAAVLWDMDGTIIDSEPAWGEAVVSMLAVHGASLDPDVATSLIGANMGHTADAMRSLGVPYSDARIVSELTDRVGAQLNEHVPFRAGALKLISDLASKGIPQALATMSYRQLVTPVLTALADELNGFEFAITIAGDEVAEGKPSPDVYLLAAKRLGVDPRDCVVLEDSLPGAASGAAAGATVVAVPLRGPTSPLADAVRPDLDAITYTDLASIHSHHFHYQHEETA
ncbi:HAD family hydrolase [Demequina aurantiaca]|uniref:HAD family hydrolase n=1 Tax=Demequina aurantiaca TaxID=676200 RepID=UPI003D32E6C7